MFLTTLTNEDLSKIVDTSDEWIFSRTGIKERRILTEGASSDMAAEAVTRSIREKQELIHLNIDLVIVATVTPDYPFPSTANVVCDKTGMKNAWGYDLIAACSGFIYAYQQVLNLSKLVTTKKYW
jgi:3-oxoacyl-[acyl-carrier-protein] synthase III